MNRYLPALSVLTAVVLCAGITPAAPAQVFDEKYSHWPEDLKINGRVIVANRLHDFDELAPLLERTAAGGAVTCIQGKPHSRSSAMLKQLQRAAGKKGEVKIFTLKDSNAGKLAAAVAASQLVYIEQAADQQKPLLALKTALQKLIRRGGTLIMAADVAHLAGKFAPPEKGRGGGGFDPPQMLDVMPGCVVQCQSDREQAFNRRDRGPRKLLEFLEDNPRTVGIAVASNTALILTGRKLTCVGRGQTTLLLPEANNRPARIESIGAYVSRRQNPLEYVADLTAWRRDAIDRDLPPFPPARPQTPDVQNGTLLIVGGGGSPRGLMNRFVELAGGAANARLVYIPCAEDEDVGQRHSIVQGWRRMGVKHATFIHTKDRRRANNSDAFLEPLKTATGLFFGGGRQWNFADSYYGTKAHQLMKNVLRRGGVVAGSSAGASIQARYLARATPIGNWRIIAPGYERGGLGFISGVAIDQHFSQRGRQKDMKLLMQTHPQLLGIGIDESTAIEVQRSTATVSGSGSVFFYDAQQKPSKDYPGYISLKAGEAYNLSLRKPVKARQKK